MLFYVLYGQSTDLKDTKRIMRQLQKNDLTNCYISPSNMFNHLFPCYVEKKDLIELRLDVLQNCDKLIVIGKCSAENNPEIAFAKLVGMEVEFIEPSNS